MNDLMKLVDFCLLILKEPADIQKEAIALAAVTLRKQITLETEKTGDSSTAAAAVTELECSTCTVDQVKFK